MSYKAWEESVNAVSKHKVKSWLSSEFPNISLSNFTKFPVVGFLLDLFWALRKSEPHSSAIILRSASPQYHMDALDLRYWWANSLKYGERTGHRACSSWNSQQRCDTFGQDIHSVNMVELPMTQIRIPRAQKNA